MKNVKSKLYLRYNEVPANPTLNFAEKMVNRFKKSDEIISIGGGSTIDVAKYVATELQIYHKAIPTTAGTGSEVTSYAVLTVDGEKKTFIVNKPDEYELDFNRLKTLDAIQIVSGGLDALCHAIESQWSPYSTPESILYAQQAEKLVWDNLLSFYKYRNEDENRGKKMLEAANYAGRAIEITATSRVHALSYGLTEKYNIPHGIACGIMMYVFGITMYAFKKNEKIKNLLTDLGIDTNSILKGVNLDFLRRRAKKSERYNNI